MSPAVAPTTAGTTVYGATVSSLQSSIAVDADNMKITGNLSFIEGGLAASGPLAGDGNFLSLTLSCSDWSVYDKVLAGLEPSEGTGLVRIDNDISEPAHTIVMKIHDNEDQVFVVESYRGGLVVREEFSLADLVCASS